MPISLKPDFYVPAPLEATYQMTSSEFFPAPMKKAPHANREGEAPSEPAEAIAAQQELRPPKKTSPSQGKRNGRRILRRRLEPLVDKQ